MKLAIGSKAHPKSEIQRALHRLVLSRVFAMIRRGLLGMKTRDSQGTLFINSTVALNLLSRVASRDFFFSTEFVFHAEKLSIGVVEIPVKLEAEIRKSTVRIFHDSVSMAWQMLKLLRVSPAPGTS